MSIIKIGFGGSCHWCTEAIFQSLIGVKEVKQGWISSVDENESFSEAVIVSFNPDEISLTVLIEIHLHTHSCTANHSMREKYRSAIYYFNDEEKNSAIDIIKQLQPDFNNQIITQVLPFSNFKLNIEEQLNYYHSNPEKPFCQNTINPKLSYLIKNFSKVIDKKKLSHLDVSDIGLGTAAIGRPVYINVNENSEKKEYNTVAEYKQNGVNFIKNAHKLGITHFDTSPGYGIAEDMLIDFLKENNTSGITVSTKWGYTYVANFEKEAIQHEIKDHSYEKLITQWEKSKQLLPNLNLYQIHSVTLESDVLDNFKIIEELYKIKKENNIDIGLSTSGPFQKEVVVKASQVKENGVPLFTSFQFTFNILDQSMKEAEDLLMDKKIIIKEALANGRLLSKEFQQYKKKKKKLDELANKYKTTQDAIAIRFCMDSYPGSITLSGANSEEHLTSNLIAKKFKLTMNELESFKEFALDSKIYWDERKQLKWN